MNRRRRKSSASRNQFTMREAWNDELQRFERWNDDEQRLFGIGHSWKEIHAEEWGTNVVLHEYRCRRCNSKHVVRFYANGLKIHISDAGNCDEIIVKQVQEG